MSPKKPERYIIGIYGEEFAIKHYHSLGFELVKKRYKTKLGEIDIILKNDSSKTIVFAEIKSTSTEYIDIEQIISKTQWRRIFACSENFMIENPIFEDYNQRFDAIFIQKGQIKHHFEDIIIQDFL
jgi:putative endonuclease